MNLICITLIIITLCIPVYIYAGSNKNQIDTIKKSINVLHSARQRTLMSLYQERFEKWHDGLRQLYEDENLTKFLKTDRERVIKTVNWSSKYSQIELMSQAQTRQEMKRLLIDVPAKIQAEGSEHVEETIDCIESAAPEINGTVLWFKTSRLNIYVHNMWAGAGGLVWTVCERKTDRFVRAPASESGCSAGEVYRHLRFKEYIRDKTPFIEAYEGGCRGRDPHYEALYDLEDNVQDVNGSVYSFPARYEAALKEQSMLYSWYVPDFKGYGTFESESWSERGERQWTRVEYVQVRSRDYSSNTDSECEDEKLARRYKCKEGRVPDPTWKRICRISKKTREVTCKRKLLRRASAEPFFDTCIECDLWNNYDRKAQSDFYRMRLDGVETLQKLGYDIPDKQIEEMLKKL